MSPDRPSALVRLADARNRAVAMQALAAKFKVTEEDPAAGDTGWLRAGYAVAVLDYEAEDARSVKLLQSATERPDAPRLIFVPPEDAPLDREQFLMALNEGAWAILPEPLEPARLLNYAVRAVAGPGRFRAEAPDASDDPGRAELEEDARSFRMRLAACERLIARLLATPPSAWARKALVVSDSPFQREQLEKLLKDHGFQVRTATGAEDGLQAALAEKPRVVISDLEMEGMDGVAFCRALKGEHRFGPCHFVVCTANPDQRARVMQPGNGVDDCLAKPSGTAGNQAFIARVALGILL